MSRQRLPLSQEPIAPFDLAAFIPHAATLNQRNAETGTTPFPQAPHRWLSHYQCTPCPMAFTAAGEVEGGLSGRLGAVIDCSCPRSLCAPSYAAPGGHCYAPASLFFLEVAAKGDHYTDYASCCPALYQQDKGRRDRELAGLHEAMPGEDDLRYCRRRVGAAIIDAALAVFVAFFRSFGLIKGALLAPDGPLAPSYSRYKGCAHGCPDCQHLPLDEAARQARRHQLQSGATRLQLLCPFPAVVQKGHEATTQAGKPHAPKVTVLELGDVPAEHAQAVECQQVAARLGVPTDEVPPLYRTRGPLTLGPQGELWGCCPKVPADLEARGGYQVAPKAPSKQERVLGSLHQRTTDITRELGLALPVGHSTYPAKAHEGPHCIAHRAALAIPGLAGQVQRGDAGYDHRENDQWSRGRGGIPGIDYNPRNEHLGPDALLKRGYDQTGTPYAPCGRLCPSNGYDFAANSRQYVCGRPCAAAEHAQCRQGHHVQGYSHRMAFNDSPRLLGPIQRGPPAWQRLYAVRTASERTNSSDQAGIANGRPLRMRGLKAFRFAGAIRTLAQLLRWALPLVLDVTYTLGKTPAAQTGKIWLFDNLRSPDSHAALLVGTTGRVRLHAGRSTRSIPQSNGMPYWIREFFNCLNTGKRDLVASGDDASGSARASAKYALSGA